MPTSTITAKGQTTVPKLVLEWLGLHPGDQIEWRQDGERVIRVIPRTVEVEDVAGFLKDKPRAHKRLTIRQMDEKMAKAIGERRR